MNAILNGQFVKSFNTFTKGYLWHNIGPIHLEVLQNFQFHFVLLYLVAATNGHLGLPSAIYLRGFYLQIILIESD